MSYATAAIKDPQHISAVAYDNNGDARYQLMLADASYAVALILTCSAEQAREIITKLEAALDGVPA